MKHIKSINESNKNLILELITFNYDSETYYALYKNGKLIKDGGDYHDKFKERVRGILYALKLANYNYEFITYNCIDSGTSECILDGDDLNENISNYYNNIKQNNEENSYNW